MPFHSHRMTSHRVRSHRGGYLAETIAYQANVIAAGGSLSSSELAATDAFISRAKSNDYWDRLRDCGSLRDSTLAAKLVKLKAYPGTSTSLVNTGFVDADMSVLGLTGGTGKSLSTGVPYASLTSGLGGLAVFLTAQHSPGAQEWYMGVGSGSTPQMTLGYNGGVFGTYGGSGATPSSSQTAAANPGYQPPGLVHVERTSASSIKLFEGGVPAGVNTTAIVLSTRVATVTVFSGGGALPTTATIGFYALTDGTMTDEHAKAFARDVNIYMAALGRATRKAGPLCYIPTIGQSLARAAQGTTPVSTAQSYLNLMFGTGVLGGNPANTAANVWTAGSSNVTPGVLTPLKEKSLEAISSGMANFVSAKHRAAGGGSTHDTLHGNWGVGGTAYSGLKKGTNPYNNSIGAIPHLMGVAPFYAETDAVVVPAILCIHGESDAPSLTYQADITTWQSDYETDIKALTGQTGDIPMFTSQPSAWTSTANLNAATSKSTVAILAAHVALPAKLPLVCPKYIFTYNADGIHLEGGAMYRWLGEYYGKAYEQHVVRGIQWEPLRPTSVVRSGATITVSLTGRVGNLALDTTMVTNPGNFGFEWEQVGGTARTIASVALSGDNTQVIITLSGDPGTPTTQRLAYAKTGIAGNDGGPTTGPRGNLRDSDPTVGPSALTLYNWCVHFDEAVS